MKRLRTVAMAAAMLMAPVFCMGADTAPSAGDAVARGEKAFAHRCAMCHREGNTGTYVLARRLGAEKSLLEKRDDLTGPYIRTVVRQGLLNMPRLSRVEMPDGDLDAVIAYLTRR